MHQQHQQKILRRFLRKLHHDELQQSYIFSKMVQLLITLAELWQSYKKF
jgi:thiamine kinase-like enzyme